MGPRALQLERRRCATAARAADGLAPQRVREVALGHLEQGALVEPLLSPRQPQLQLEGLVVGPERVPAAARRRPGWQAGGRTLSWPLSWPAKGAAA